MRRLLVSLCLCSLSITPAAARMYQWRSPATGTTQLSGTPPAWYRTLEGGPRVYVFDANRLVDDTGIAVSDEQRRALRAAAFGEVETAQPEPVARPPVTATAPPPPSATTPGAPTVTPPAASGGADEAAALKALIEAWDQRQVDQVRAVIEAAPAADAPAP
ncbi:MAG: hypothetical protein AB7P42_19925 [Gammaproteobacteria bacterium]